MKKLLSLLVASVILISALPCSADNSTGTASAHLYTFEDLTGFSRDDINHITIRSGLDGTPYSTDNEKVITDIYDTINTKTFFTLCAGRK